MGRNIQDRPARQIFGAAPLCTGCREEADEEERISCASHRIWEPERAGEQEKDEVVHHRGFSCANRLRMDASCYGFAFMNLHYLIAPILPPEIQYVAEHEASSRATRPFNADTESVATAS